MKNFIFDQERYLERISLFSDIDTTAGSLESLLKSQLRTIPFENFDICLNRAIKVDTTVVVEKLVRHRRGGYCFELNGLLLTALQSFGFDARALLARVHVSETPTGRGHQVSLVTVQGKQWIVDAGFGAETPPVPIPLTFNEPISSNGQTFCLKEDSIFGYMLQIKNGKSWKDLYSFDLNYVCLGDIEYGNHFTSTSHESIFTNARTAAIQTENGVITLFNHTVKNVINGHENEIELEKGEAYIKALETNFGIELDAKYEDLKPISDMNL